MAYYVLYVVAALLAVNTADAIKCYSCNTNDNVACGYSLLSFSYSSIDCDTKSGNSFVDTVVNFIPKSCIKIVGKDNEGHEYIARSCGLKGVCEVEAKAIGLVSSNIKEFTCYTCDGDNCNSATKFTGVTFLGLIIACFVYLL